MAPKYEVELYVYDLSQGMAKTLGPLIINKNIEGIWHTGVNVYGREYFFGSNGIQYVEPGTTILGHTYKIMPMGKTEVTIDIFEDYLRDLSSELFSADKYNLLEHNCNTFSNTVVSFLLNKQIPQYILDLPKEIQDSHLGVLLKPMLENVIRGQRMVPSGGTPLLAKHAPSTSAGESSSSEGKKEKKDAKKDKKNKNNMNASKHFDGGHGSDEEVEERRMRLQRLLRETLQRYRDEEARAEQV